MTERASDPTLPTRIPGACRPRGAVLAIAAGYAVVASLWILFSDTAIEALFSDPVSLTHASMVKGWAFVAVTAILLYALVGRLVCRATRLQQDRQRTLGMLTAVAEGSQDAVFAKDAEGRYLLANGAVARFLGLPVEQIVGRTDRDLFPPEQAEVLQAFARRVMAAGHTETMEESLDTVLGRRTFLATKGPLRDETGRAIGIFGVSRDITDSKNIEDRLRDQAALLGAVCSMAQIGGWSFDPATGQGEWTAETARIHDLPPDAPIDVERGLSFYTGVHRDRILTAIHDAVEHALPYDLELEIETTAGRRKWVHTTGLPESRDGRVVKVWGTMQDITERRKAEAESRRLADDMAATLQAIPDVMIELDRDGRHLAVRAGQEAGLVAPAEQLIGRSVAEVLPPDSARTVLDALDGAARTGFDFGRTMSVPLSGGTRWFELSVSRKGGSEFEAARFIVLARDVTERKVAVDGLRQQASELAARNSELERFNRAMVHRELDMIELKRQLNALSRQLGRPMPHPGVAEHADPAPVARP